MTLMLLLFSSLAYINADHEKTNKQRFMVQSAHETDGDCCSGAGCRLVFNHSSNIAIALMVTDQKAVHRGAHKHLKIRWPVQVVAEVWPGQKSVTY